MNDLRARAIPASDRILPATRLVAAAVIPFLVAAFVILYLPGNRTAEWFAWPITPQLTAAIMGAGYLAGAYFFGRVVAAGRAGARWHEVAAGFLPVTVFTAMMLLSTLLHWETFSTDRWPFWVWLAIYIVTPVVVPWVWWRNLPSDPGLSATDYLLPAAVRPLMMGFGIALWTAIVIGFIRPQLIIDIWPWTLTPLTARVMLGWQSLLATGAIVLAQERRWSGWRIPMQSILFWQAMVVVAFGLFGEEMTTGRLNWYVVYTVGGLLAAAVFYAWAETQSRRQVRQ